MKKINSLLITMAIVCSTLCVFGISSSAAYIYGENIIPEGDFERGLSSEFVANNDAGNKAVLTRVVKENPTKTNRVLLISNRNTNAATNGVAYDLNQLFREKDENGDYKYISDNGLFYISAKVRLKNEGDKAFVRSSIYKWSSTPSGRGTIWWGSGSALNYEVAGSNWTEIGVRNHNTIKYNNFSKTNIDESWLNTDGNKIKLQIGLFQDSTCKTPYSGDFYLDEVYLFFIKDANQNTPTDKRDSLLENYDFEKIENGDAIDYSATRSSDWGKEGTTWFAENATISVVEMIEVINSEDTVDPEGVHTGAYGMKVSNRPNTQLGIGIELTKKMKELGPTQDGEVYHISAWMKTTSPDAEMYVVPIWGNKAPVGNAYLEGDSKLSFRVTNEWTEIGFDVGANQYYIFNRQGSTSKPDEYNPSSADWSSLRFNTINSTDDYYIDDIRIWKEKYSVDDMNKKIDAMLSAEEIFPENRTGIEHIRNLFNMFEDKENINSDKLIAAETELEKFKTQMEFTCGCMSESGFLYLQPNKSYSEVRSGIKAANGDVTVHTSQGEELREGYISTGMSVKLTYKSIILQSVAVVAYGDGNSDGVCDIRDLVTAKKYMADQKDLTDMQVQALKVFKDGSAEVTTADMIQIKKYLLGVIQEF